MRYFFGFLLTIGLVILVIILIFSGGGKPKVSLTAKTLVSYASTNAEARLTTDGPIDATSIHQQVRVTVDRDNVTYEQIEGYDGNVVKTQRYANTQNAYNDFLAALSHAGFTKGNIDKKLADESGYCPLGNRYIMELRQNDKIIERFWTTTCNNPKTYGGNKALTIALFRAQVPDYNKLVEDLAL